MSISYKEVAGVITGLKAYVMGDEGTRGSVVS
jgi:hypothetical protein